MSEIFVNGIWKSGNHLVYSALNEFGLEGPVNGLSAHLTRGKFSHLKKLIRVGYDKNNNIDVGLENQCCVSPSWIEKVFKKADGRIIGGHACYSSELYEFFFKNNVKIVLIVRNPLDLLVSYADWIGSRPDYYMHSYFKGLSREEIIFRLLKGSEGEFFPFKQVLDRFSPWLDKPNVLTLKFEDLIGPHGGGGFDSQTKTVIKLLEFMEIEKPCNFESKIKSIYGGTLTFNNGGVNRSMNLDSEFRNSIKCILDEHMKIYGYS